MKQRFFQGIVAIFIVTMITSCTKDPISPSIPLPPPPPPIATELHVFASQWEQGIDGEHYSRLEGILNRGSFSHIDVYVKELDDHLLIPENGIYFRNGYLWYQLDGHDLVVFYMGSDPSLPLPFDQLEIRVVFE